MADFHFTYNYADHAYTACDANSADTSAGAITFLPYSGTLDDFQKFRITKDELPVEENIASQLRKKIQQALLDTSFKTLSEPSAALLRRPDYPRMEPLDVAIENLILRAKTVYSDNHISAQLTAELQNQRIQRRLKPLIYLFYTMKAQTWAPADVEDLFRLLDFIAYVRLMKLNDSTPATITFIGDTKLQEQLKTLVNCLPDLNIIIKYKKPNDAKARTIYSLTQRLHHARDDTFETAGMTRKERWLYSYLGMPRPNANQNGFITGLQWTAFALGGFALNLAKSFLRRTIELPLYYVETQAAHWYLNNRHDKTKNKTLVSAANVAANIFKALRATVRACLSPIKSYRHAAAIENRGLSVVARIASVVVSSGFIGALIVVVGPLLATHLLPKLGIHVALNFSASSITTGTITTTEAIYGGAALGLVGLQETAEALATKNFELKVITPPVSAAPTRASTPPPVIAPPVKSDDTKSITSIKSNIVRDDSGNNRSGDFKLPPGEESAYASTISAAPDLTIPAVTTKTLEQVETAIAENLARRTAKERDRDHASVKAACEAGFLPYPSAEDLANQFQSVIQDGPSSLTKS